METTEPAAERQWLPWALLMTLAVAFVTVRAVAIGTESVNWDEFALMQRTANMLRSGQIQGGGRPGVVELMLAPFVSGCRDAIAAVQGARVLWTGLTVGAIAGLYVLLLQLRRRTREPWVGAAVGVGMLALVPVFLRWSIHVRTDQPALLLGLWGGVALLASRRRAWTALAAGGLFGAGFLCTQKVVYVGGLVLTLWLIDATQDPGGWRSRDVFLSLIRRLGLLMLGLLAVAAAYAGLLPLFVRLPATVATLGSGLSTFAYYRSFFGFAAYLGMLPSLAVHMVMLVLLLAATVSRDVRHGRDARLLISSWSALVLGAAVALFHSGAFPYFWMTLGVFPAVAIAMAIDPIQSLFERASSRRIVPAAAILVLVVQAVPTARAICSDTQAIQRESLAFVDRNFAPGDRGFQAEGALFCRVDPRPFPVLFSEGILRRFFGAQAPAEISAFIAQFRSRPVKFMIGSHVLNQFPDDVRRFWNSNYVRYHSQVYVPGHPISVTSSGPAAFETIVTGHYCWLPGDGRSQIAIDGRVVAAGERLALRAGPHLVSAPASTHGTLVLALGEGSNPGREPFYDREAILDITGGGYAASWESVVEEHRRSR